MSRLDINIENLELHKEDAELWFELKETKQTVVFPTPECLVETLIEYNQAHNKYNYALEELAHGIRELLKEVDIETLAKIAYSPEDCEGNIPEETIDKVVNYWNNQEDEYSPYDLMEINCQWLYFDYCKYCLYQGMHYEYMVKPRYLQCIKQENPENIENTDEFIKLDTEIKEGYCYFNEIPLETYMLPQLFYCLTDSEKEQANKEYKQAQSIEDIITKSPTIIKALTLVIQEILDVFVDDDDETEEIG